MHAKIKVTACFVATVMWCAYAQAGFNEGLAAYETHDYITAFNEWKALAESGDREAQYRLGDLYLNGQGVITDGNTVVYWFEKAANQGQARAQAKLAMVFAEGKLVPVDQAKALMWYIAAATNGDVEAQVNLASLYAERKTVPHDAAKALHWMEQAANNGHKAAQYNLGLWYAKGENVPRDDVLSRHWYLLSAEQGLPNAQTQLAMELREGLGGKIDIPGALSWLRKAADQDYSEAQFALGALYAKGQDVQRDYGQAVYWFQKASDLGNAHAQAALGLMYVQGTGVPQDNAMAIRYYQLAAGQGLVEVQCALASMYDNGIGVKQDVTKALKWYRKAADGGNLPAMTAVGRSYELGNSVEKDFDQAETWYRKAADLGYRDAKEKLAALQNYRKKLASDPGLVTREENDLFNLVRKGNLAAVEQALKTEGKSVNEVDAKGSSLLEIAIESHQPEIAKYLITQGADVNHANGLESTPITYAAFHGMPEIIQLLAQRGADVNHHNKNSDRPPIYFAANNGDYKTVETLLQVGADPNQADVQGVTPLTIAMSGGHKEVVQLLLDQGARVDKVDAWKGTPIDGASRWTGWSDIVKTMIAHGAPCGSEPNTTDDLRYAGDIEIVHLLAQCIKERTGKEPQLDDTLVHAAGRCNAKLVADLIALGVDVNGKPNTEKTPLSAAITCSDDFQVVRTLIENGADPNLHDNEGLAPLHHLGWSYKPTSAPLVDYLVAHGADVNLRAREFVRPTALDINDAPLHYAVSAGKREYVQALLAHDAKVDMPGAGDRTPLTVAIERGQTEIAAILLAHGANIEGNDTSDESPLSAAIKSNRRDLVEFVLLHGANPNRSPGQGLAWKLPFPLNIAVESGHLSIVKTLVEHGANPALMQDNHDSALKIAIINNRLDIVRYFLEKFPNLSRKFDLNTMIELTQDDELRAYLLKMAGKRETYPSDDVVCERLARMMDSGKFRKIVSKAANASDAPSHAEKVSEGQSNGMEPISLKLDKISFSVKIENKNQVDVTRKDASQVHQFTCMYSNRDHHTIVLSPEDRLPEVTRNGQSDPASIALKTPGLTSIKALLAAAKQRADLGFWASEDGRAYLLLMATNIRPDIVDYLLNLGVSPDHALIELKIPDGALSEKAREHINLIKMIHGEDVTPLFLAVKMKNEDGAEMLLQHGANPNRGYTHGLDSSVLAITASDQNASMMKILLLHGAVPSTVGGYQFDELIKRQGEEEIKLLLDFGLDRNDVGHKEGVEMQRGDLNRNNPDAVDMIVKMDPTKWHAKCNAKPPSDTPDNCLPVDLREVDEKLRIMFATDESNTGRRKEKQWYKRLAGACGVIPESGSRDGWYASILSNQHSAICVIAEMQNQVKAMKRR